MSTIRAWAAQKVGGKLQPFEYDPGPLGAEEVEIAVEHCGICHSDLSLLDNDWGMTQYPFVPGHEAIGRVVAMGAQAKGVSLGQRVGLGWNSHSCMHCKQCLMGQHNLCESLQPTLIGRHGAFADTHNSPSISKKFRIRQSGAPQRPPAGVNNTKRPRLFQGLTDFPDILVRNEQTATQQTARAQTALL